MALTTRLNLRQLQTMTMTPQLLQSIKLLQLTQLELEQFVDQQVESNPLIERVSTGDDNFADRDSGSNSDQVDPESHDWASSDLEVSAAAISDKLDSSLANVFPDDPGNGDGGTVTPQNSTSLPGLPMAGRSESDYSLEEFVQTMPSLRDVVMEQIPFIFSDRAQQAIAVELTDRLDERGYVEFDLAALSERLGCTQDMISTVLSGLQSCDPAGIFARDLAECLSLQCARKNRLDPAMLSLLDNLDLLARRDFKSLSQMCGVDEGDLIDMLEEIRRLDPRPGLAYETSPTQGIIHDVEVSAAPDGTWRIELNNDALPRIIVDRQYYAEVSGSKLKKEEKTFIADCMANATWLERSLDQRATTILKVATEIVTQQDRFLTHGVSGLKPMTMKSVADAISMHESTVSRIASNKYILTPRGLFEIRYFFTVAISGTGEDGGEYSSESVRQRIRDLIDNETIEKVLSDDTLVSLLKDEGIEIARRTVAKYREGMNIASSVQRRREKKAKLSSSHTKR
jgi:RNA polymerase sigma-54 factor